MSADVYAGINTWERASAQYAASRRDALTEQMIADAHAAPIDLDASLSDAVLAQAPAVQDPREETYVLRGEELRAYREFAKATAAAKLAQEALASASKAMREAIGGLSQVVPAFDEAEWRK